MTVPLFSPELFIPETWTGECSHLPYSCAKEEEEEMKEEEKEKFFHEQIKSQFQMAFSITFIGINI